MRILRTIFGFLSLTLVLGGSLTLFWQYFRNKQLFVVLMSNSIVKGSMSVLRNMLFAVIAIIVGLIFFSVYLKIAGWVRRNEREKQARLEEQQRLSEETARQLRKEAEDAKAEIEQVKKENELMKMTFMRKPEEEETAETSVEE